MSYFCSNFITSRQWASFRHLHIQALMCSSGGVSGNPEQTQLSDCCQGSQSTSLTTSTPVGSRIFCVSGVVRSPVRRVGKSQANEFDKDSFWHSDTVLQTFIWVSFCYRRAEALLWEQLPFSWVQVAATVQLLIFLYQRNLIPIFNKKQLTFVGNSCDTQSV